MQVKLKFTEWKGCQHCDHKVLPLVNLGLLIFLKNYSNSQNN